MSRIGQALVRDRVMLLEERRSNLKLEKVGSTPEFEWYEAIRISTYEVFSVKKGAISTNHTNN